MNSCRRFGFILALAASMPLLLPPSSTFADGKAFRSSTLDVVLTADRSLQGQLVDPNGAPISGSQVRLLSRGRTVAVAETGPQGEFQMRSVRGGVHQLVTDRGVAMLRCWTPETAPPSALKEVMLVSDGKTLRGQQPISNLFTNPLIIGLAVAAAIAIPIAVNNSDTNGSSP